MTSRSHGPGPDRPGPPGPAGSCDRERAATNQDMTRTPMIVSLDPRRRHAGRTFWNANAWRVAEQGPTAPLCEMSRDDARRDGVSLRVRGGVFEDDGDSTAACRLDCGDVDLLHRHHRIEYALGGCAIG